jgi:hypothetical protein
MLRPKKGFKNSQVSFRVGSATHTIKVSDITPELMDKVKHHVDLSYFVEEVEIPKLSDEALKKWEAVNDKIIEAVAEKIVEEVEKHETIYNPEEHDIETVLQKHLNEKPKKKTRKKKI